MAGLITEFLGEGLAGSRPATPDIPSGAIAFWYSTDSNEMSAYADGAWQEDVFAGGGGLLNDLTDVDTSGVADGDVLTYDSGSGDWVPAASSGGGTDIYTGNYQLILPIVNSATPQAIGCAATVAGTVARTLASTNEFTKRKRLGVTVAGTNTFSQVRCSDTSGAIYGVGNGWRFRARFGVQAAVANSRLLVGFQGGWSGAQDPSAATGAMLIVGKDSADTNLQVIHNDAAGAAVKVNLGASFPANTSVTDIYEVEFSSANGASTIAYTVTNLTTGATTSGTLSSDIPAAYSLASFGVYAATAATAGHSLDVFAIEYVQTYSGF